MVANAKKKKEPEILLSVEKEEDGVEDSVHYITKLLKKKNGNRPILFYQLVLNPDSFVISVQNKNHASFLCNDSNIEMRFGDNDWLLYHKANS